MPIYSRRFDRTLQHHLGVCTADWWVGMLSLMVLLLGSAMVSPPMRTLWLALPGSLGGLTSLLTPLPPPQPQLFATLDGLGVVAIGHAEGNLTVVGEPTGNYWGHRDPGNFRRNQGWCSDQGRGGGNVERANQKCLERVQQRLNLIKNDLKAAGLEPSDYPLALINAVDLYNQASPWVSRQFPQAYQQAQAKGYKDEQAMVWARVEAFRRRGKIDASGLIGICRREGRQVSDWDCVAADQRRRVRAIERVWVKGHS
ncbi:MAG: hypothetical protein F6J87_29360 [Spirulina sp. SIO3F2]|nr:hypothetical protein [Spirulina sp. SIO3F2]